MSEVAEASVAPIVPTMSASPAPTPTAPGGFVDRRNPAAVEGMPICERRQFGNSHEGLSPEAGELARAIDQYKLYHRRRFITYEEMLAVVKSLGYHK